MLSGPAAARRPVVGGWPKPLTVGWGAVSPGWAKAADPLAAPVGRAKSLGVAVGRAKSFAARVEKTASDDEQRVKAAYRIAFTRDPDPRELRIGLAFLKLPARPEDKLTRWQQYAQALLASNEFLYLD